MVVYFAIYFFGYPIQTGQKDWFFFEKTLRFHVKYLWRGGGHRVNKWLSADLPAWISGNLSFKYVLLIPKFDPNPFYLFFNILQ